MLPNVNHSIEHIRNLVDYIVYLFHCFYLFVLAVVLPTAISIYNYTKKSQGENLGIEIKPSPRLARG